MISAPRGRALGFALALALLTTPAAAAEFPLAPGDTAIGQIAAYTTRKGDNLADIARRFDIGYTEMLAANPGVDPWLPGAGRRLTIPSFFILPGAPRRGIVINLAERRLYYFPPGGNTVVTYPIGIGAIGFTTPLSTTRVVRKEPNPVWIPPPSIRAEQPWLPAEIGPGPDDPLGAYALRLGWTNYLIHGTNKPDGVGRNVSHGCIHLYPEDIEKLFNSVAVGTPVRVVSQSSAAAWLGDGGLYLEVHPDKQQADQIDMEQSVARSEPQGLRAAVTAMAVQYADAVDWDAVGKAGMQRTGLPVEIATRPAGAEAPPPVAAVPAQDRGYDEASQSAADSEPADSDDPGEAVLRPPAEVTDQPSADAAADQPAVTADQPDVTADQPAADDDPMTQTDESDPSAGYQRDR